MLSDSRADLNPHLLIILSRMPNVWLTEPLHSSTILKHQKALFSFIRASLFQHREFDIRESRTDKDLWSLDHSIQHCKCWTNWTIVIINYTEASKGFVFIHNELTVSTQEIQHNRVQNRYGPLILRSFHPSWQMFDHLNLWVDQLYRTIKMLCFHSWWFHGFNAGSVT
jgi:hypothetical protein